MTADDVWRLVLDNESYLRAQVRKFLPPGSRHLLEEAYSDVVVGRALSIMETYDSAKGASPKTHLCVNVRWYAFKWVSRRRRELCSEDLSAAPARSLAYEEDLSAVYSSLEGLPDETRRLLEWRFVKDYTVSEIAAHLGVSAREAGSMIRKALEEARVRCFLLEFELEPDDGEGGSLRGDGHGLLDGPAVSPRRDSRDMASAV